MPRRGRSAPPPPAAPRAAAPPPPRPAPPPAQPPAPVHAPPPSQPMMAQAQPQQPSLFKQVIFHSFLSRGLNISIMSLFSEIEYCHLKLIVFYCVIRWLLPLVELQ